MATNDKIILTFDTKNSKFDYLRASQICLSLNSWKGSMFIRIEFRKRKGICGITEIFFLNVWSPNFKALHESIS